MSSIEILQNVQRESVFTVGLSFKVYVAELCSRYTKIYGEILPHNDYNYIVKRLSEKGII